MVVKVENIVRKLRRREIGSIANKSRSIKSSGIKFRNFQLEEEFDIYDPNSPCFVKGIFYKPRSRILQLETAEDIVFAWDASSVCAAFTRVGKRRICYLNRSFEEVIRGLFVNNNTRSVTTLSQTYAGINSVSIYVRGTRIDDIKNGRPEAGNNLLVTNVDPHRDFVRIDYLHMKALTFRADTGIINVFDLNNNTNLNILLYSISDKRIDQVRFDAGVILFKLKNYNRKSIPIHILSVHDGTVLKSLNYEIPTENTKVEFIKLFSWKLILKQDNGNVEILDLRNEQLSKTENTELIDPSCVCLFKEIQSVLTMHNGTVCIWDLKGKLITSYEEHLPQINDVRLVTDRNQDFIIYLRPHANGPSSIKVSHVLTGNCVAEINSNEGRIRSNIPTPVEEALRDITTLFYDKERHQIYTGNMQAGYMFGPTNSIYNLLQILPCVEFGFCSRQFE